MHGGGACMVGGGVHDRGACVVGGMHGGGHAWQGACMAGGMHGGGQVCEWTGGWEVACMADTTRYGQ